MMRELEKLIKLAGKHGINATDMKIFAETTLLLNTKKEEVASAASSSSTNGPDPIIREGVDFSLYMNHVVFAWAGRDPKLTQVLTWLKPHRASRLYMRELFGEGHKYVTPESFFLKPKVVEESTDMIRIIFTHPYDACQYTAVFVVPGSTLGVTLSTVRPKKHKSSGFNNDFGTGGFSTDDFDNVGDDTNFTTDEQFQS